MRRVEAIWCQTRRAEGAIGTNIRVGGGRHGECCASAKRCGTAWDGPRDETMLHKNQNTKHQNANKYKER